MTLSRRTLQGHFTQSIGGNREWRLVVQKTRVKKKCFSSRRKVVSDDAARTADSRLFHARGAATENDNKDDKQYHRTARPENSRPRSTLPYHNFSKYCYCNN